MRSRDTTATMDASFRSDILSINTLDILGVLLDTHGANLVHNPVELLKSGVLATSDADDLALAERLEANGKRADIAAEETRDKDGGDKRSDGKNDLNPANDATGKKNLGVPHDHPGNVSKEGGSRREDGEGRVRSLPVRILIREVILGRELGRGITLRSDVNRPQERNTKDGVLHVLKLPGGAAAETNALDGNDGHDILKKTHGASPGAKSTTSNEASAKDHTVVLFDKKGGAQSRQ